MDAKEYFENYYGNNPPVFDRLDFQEMQIFAESYHLQKSKEEAGARYNESIMAYENNIDIVMTYELKSIFRIASGHESK